jgi:prepilin-type N-terminal cleavage/methylation domain-containing protein
MSKGFSLIELLVAMSIMSMTLLISSMGYSFFMERWQKNLGQFDKSAQLAKKLVLTQQALQSVFPYILRDDNGEPAIYFEGQEDGFITVTQRPFFSSGKPSMIRLSIVQNTDFSFGLVYEEAQMTVPLTKIVQQHVFNRKVRLIDHLTDIKFSYLGHEDINSRTNKGQLKWWQSFNGLNRQILPQAIRLTMKIEDKEEEIDFLLNQVDQRTVVLFRDTF